MPDLQAAARYFGCAVAGLGLGALGSYFVTSRKQGPEAELAGKLNSHSAAKYGLPNDQVVRVFSDFITSFDTRQRNPKWVLEHVTAAKGQGSADRKKSEFFEDAELHRKFRSKLEDFKGSGYDRGHLAPAGNYKHRQESMNETFTLMNMSPQVGKGFNRDYWARFERFVKELTKKADEVFVVTGPLYLPKPSPSGFVVSYPLIGRPPEFVAVPTHFFKVVLAEKGGKAAVGAFVMPNEPIEPDTPLLSYAVPLSALESISGLNFFPAYLDDSRRGALDDATRGWQAIGRAQLSGVKALKGKSAAVPLLTDGGQPAPGGKPAPSWGQQSVTILPPRPVTGPGGKGAVHLCEFTECALPVAEFWKRSNSFSSKGDSPA